MQHWSMQNNVEAAKARAIRPATMKAEAKVRSVPLLSPYHAFLWCKTLILNNPLIYNIYFICNTIQETRVQIYWYEITFLIVM